MNQPSSQSSTSQTIEQILQLALHAYQQERITPQELLKIGKTLAGVQAQVRQQFSHRLQSPIDHAETLPKDPLMEDARILRLPRRTLIPMQPDERSMLVFLHVKSSRS